MAAAGSSGYGADSAGGGEVEYGPEAPTIPSVPGNDSPYDDAELPIDSLLLFKPDVHYSIGVYTHSGGDYYLIKVSGGKLYAAKLYFTDPGESLQRLYLQSYENPSTRGLSPSGNSDQIKHEAYILGQAETKSEWVEIGTYRLVGAPLDYGWNFNWKGDRATCVTHKPNYTTTIGDENSYLINWTSRLYSLAVTESEDGLVGSIELVTDKNWEPENKYPYVWVHDSQSRLVPAAWVGCDPFQVAGYGLGDSDGDLYSFYKASGDLEVISFVSGAYPTKTMAELRQEAREATCHCYGNRWYGLIEKTDEFFGAIGGREAGFVTTSNDYKEREIFGGYYLKWDVKITDNGGYTGQDDSVACMTHLNFEQYTNTELEVPDDVDYYGAAWKMADGEYHYEVSNDATPTTYVVKTAHAIILPKHSTESVYLARYVNTYKALTISDYVAENLQWSLRPFAYGGAWLADWTDTEFPVRSTLFCEGATYPWVNYCKPTTNHDIMPFLGCGFTQTEDTTSYSMLERTYSVNMDIVSAFEENKVDSIETDDFYELGRYQILLVPNICTGTELPPANNFQSVLGNSIRLENGVDWEYGSNNDLSPDVAEPYGLWIGRS